MVVPSNVRQQFAPVDIVVPVYNAAAELSRCVESVLEHAGGDWRLTLASNPSNLGFTLTANRGMREARPGADVVLLNSDTVVTRGWLAALSRCAASDPRIGTITPFSNNAEICSLPRFCANNPWPEGKDPAPLAEALARSAVPT